MIPFDRISSVFYSEGKLRCWTINVSPFLLSSSFFSLSLSVLRNSFSFSNNNNNNNNNKVCSFPSHLGSRGCWRKRGRTLALVLVFLPLNLTHVQRRSAAFAIHPRGARKNGLEVETERQGELRRTNRKIDKASSEGGERGGVGVGEGWSSDKRGERSCRHGREKGGEEKEKKRKVHRSFDTQGWT